MERIAADVGGGTKVHAAPEPAGILLAIDRVKQYATQELRSTPARLRLASVFVVALLMAAAVLALPVLNGQRATVRELRTRSAPALIESHNARIALLEADAIASSAFLEGGLERPQNREAYDRALARAASKIALVTRLSDRTAAGPASAIAPLVGRYAAAVEAARANNRQGFPIGAAYQREASALLRDEVLPSTRAVDLVNLERLKDRYASLQGTDYAIFIVLILAVIALLVSVQLYLTAKTRRALNLPLAASTALVVLTLLGAIGTGNRQMSDVRQSVRIELADVLDRAGARVDAFSAKANESLGLIARANSEPYRLSFQRDVNRISALLQKIDREQGLEPVTRASFAAFVDQHEAIERLVESGEYQNAVDLAIERSAASPTNEFADLDAQLGRSLDDATARFDSAMRGATGRFRVARWLVPTSLILAAALAMIGIQQRISEYR